MHARAHATNGRTDVLTQKNSPNDESFSFVTRAGGLEKSHRVGRGQRWSRTSDSSIPCLEVPDAQGYPGRPLANLERLAASTPLTRRVSTLKVGIERHRIDDDAACSPVARWRGRSDGSNPLRPPRLVPAASRFKGDCALGLSLEPATDSVPYADAFDCGRVSAVVSWSEVSADTMRWSS